MPNPTMLVTPVDSITNYPAIPAGNDRIAVLIVNYVRGSAGTLTLPNSVAVAGVPATYLGGDAPGAVVDRAGLTVWIFKEAQIASISGGAVTISGGVDGTSTRANAFVIQDTNQGVISRVAMQRVLTGAMSISLARAANSYTVYSGYVQVAEDITITNPARVMRISNINYAYAADTAQTVNTTTQSKSYVQTGTVVNFEQVPAQQITGLTDPLVIGGSYTVNTTGFADGAATLSFSGVSSAHTIASGSATASLPPLSDNLLCPFLPATGVTVTETQGALTATISRNISVQSGWDVLRDGSNNPTNFAGIVLGNSRYIGQAFVDDGNPLTTSDRAYYPTAYGLVIDPDGRVQINATDHPTDPVPSLPYTTSFFVHRASDGRMYEHGLTIDEEGGVVVDSIGLVVRGLTAEGLVMRAMTVRGL